MRSARFSLALGAFSLVWGSTQVHAQLADPIPGSIPKSSTVIALQPVAAGLTAPNLLTHAGDGTDRLFVVDQAGSIRLIKNGALEPTAYLDVSSDLVTLNPGFDERGLLGLAFHPDFSNSGTDGFGKLYTYTSELVDGAGDFTVGLPPGSLNHQSIIREWSTATPTNDVFSGTSRELMRIDQPQSNHNGGMLAIGPDGNLYAALGDGGGRDDEGSGHSAGGNGQDAANILGTIIRINPDPASATGTLSDNGQYRIPSDNPFVNDASKLNEIYAYGLRNPFRFSFDVDPATGQAINGTSGNLIVGDVGQGDIEEVNVITGPTADPNFGWPLKEGSFTFDGNGGGPGFVTANSPNVPADLIDPVIQYDHDEGTAVIGGFVYRGTAIAELIGKYIFGEFSSGSTGRLFVGDLDTGSLEELTIGLGDETLGLLLKGFGQDADGELYVLAGSGFGPSGTSGVVLKIIPEPRSLFALLIMGAATLRRRHRFRSTP